MSHEGNIINNTRAEIEKNTTTSFSPIEYMKAERAIIAKDKPRHNAKADLIKLFMIRI